MRSKILSFIIAASLIVSLCYCANSKNSSANSNEKNQTVSDNIAAQSTWTPKVSQRDILESEGTMCGVLYLGYAESDMFDMANNRPYYDKFFKDSGSVKIFPFLKDIPESQFVCTPLGHDLYVIIPTDPKAHVEVNLFTLDEENDYSLKVEDTLYSSDVGAPFVLQCNYSDIFTDAQVVITDSKGETLKWSPFISLRDGKVQNTTEDNKTVHDFTEYEFVDDSDEE